MNVILDLVDPVEKWHALGHGYQVDVHIIDWQTDRAITVPVTALFRSSDGFAIYQDIGGIVRLTQVQVGHRAGLCAEVTAGLGPSSRIVVNPGDRVEDGVRIRQC